VNDRRPLVGVLRDARSERLRFAADPRALDTPDLRERFSAIGVTRVDSTPEALATRIEQDANKWAAVIHNMRARASE
jgi:tripartite-type tricarboxylate transporter receptor subunit TctC